MNPRDIMPEWESDFWRDLLAEEPKVTIRGEPDEFFYETTGRSQYDNGNVIVGEIVEDEPLEISA